MPSLISKLHASADAVELCWEAANEIKRLRLALENIINPIAGLQKELEDTGLRINGRTANELAESPTYLRNIARDALRTP